MIIKKRKQNLGEEKKIETTLETSVVDNSVENFAEPPEEVVNEKVNKVVEEEIIDLFDIENVDFTQRQERRRGSRRRGYRRIDDRNLVSRAQEESENIKKSAFEEGYRLGLEKATTDIEKFKVELENFMGARKEVFEYIAPDILEISVDIAQTIIKKELESDPQLLINTIVDVLRAISKSESKITIRTNPQYVQFIKDSIPNITYQYGIESKINLVSDPSIEEGGCVLETNNGIVDASIDTQLEIIKKALDGLNTDQGQV